MPSVIDICNSALDKLGEKPIVSLDDGNKAANLCTRNWPLIRDQLLRDHPWNFAIKRTNLAPESTTPDWGYTAQFVLPDDCLKVVEVKDMTSDEYAIENNGRILANATVLYIRYVYRAEDPNDYDSQFIDAVSLRLAIQLCESLTQNTTKKTELRDEYIEVLARTKSSDAQENPPITEDDDTWLAVRY